MGKSILGCTKNDFLLDPRTPEGEQYYAENPNLLYLIRQSYGGKYPNNDEGTGDTPWTTMPNCVAYAWARCMEIWVPYIEKCANYNNPTYYNIFNNMQPFYDGLDFLRKVYDIDRLAQGNGEDMIANLYKTTDLNRTGDWTYGFKYFHLDYITPWRTPMSQFAHGVETLYRIGTHLPTTLDIHAQGLSEYEVTNYEHLRPTFANQYQDITEKAQHNYGTIEQSALLLHPANIHDLMWRPTIEATVPIGSILVFGSGHIKQGRAGHVMVVEDGSSFSEIEMIDHYPQYDIIFKAKQLVPTISDANIPHGNWGRTVKYYDWTRYAGSIDRDKYNHVYRDEAEDFLEGIILPPLDIVYLIAMGSTTHRNRFGKTNLVSPKTRRRIHAGIQDYTPE